jgi:GDSL-like lipase/acylhydrolase family protein
VRFVRLALGVLILFTACDGADTQVPPLDPPSGDPSPGGGACSKTEVDGATVTRFGSEGSCLPGDVMVLFRCSATAIPVLRIASVAGPALFLGGPFAVPVTTLPAHVRFAGAAHGTDVLIADPPSPAVTAAPSVLTPSVEGGSEPIPEPEPLVYVRHDGVTQRWLRLEGRRTLNEPPLVWVIGDSIMDGGRDALEAGLSDWSVTLDAEVGRSSSSGIALGQDAVDQDADAVIMELGTNDSSTETFRGHLIETLNILASVPLVLWQTARGHEDQPTIQAVNEAIREVVPTYPNVAIADWEAFAPDEAFQTDGVHPDEGFEQLESELLVPILSEWRGALSTGGATSCGRKVVLETS